MCVSKKTQKTLEAFKTLSVKVLLEEVICLRILTQGLVEISLHRVEIVVPLPLQLRCKGECVRRLSKGQASLPLRSPCTTLAASIWMTSSEIKGHELGASKQGVSTARRSRFFSSAEGEKMKIEILKKN